MDGGDFLKRIDHGQSMSTNLPVLGSDGDLSSLAQTLTSLQEAKKR